MDKWIEKEVNFLINNYEKLGQRGVAKHLNKHRITVSRKAKKLGLKLRVDNFVRVEVLKDVVKVCLNYKEVLEELNKIVNGKNYKILKEYIKKYNIDVEHFDAFYKNRNRETLGYDISFWLKNGTKIGSSKLKKKLYKEGLKQRICEKCGQDENWKGVKISLILDHINGINDDNRLENLRIVCPNCNAGLETYCGKNIVLKKKLKKYNL